MSGSEALVGSSGPLNPQINGTYSIGGDGRGTLTLTSLFRTDNYRCVVGIAGQIQLIGADSGDSMNGFAAPQDRTAANLSAIAGNWTFFLSGTISGTPTLDVGRFTLDSAGNITLGVLDENSKGTVTSSASFTGTASSVSTDGLGTASLSGAAIGTPALEFYIDSANTIYFTRVDSGSIITGSAYRQQSPSFTNSSLNGNYAFLLTGNDSAGGSESEIGEVFADGNGNIGGFDQIGRRIDGTYDINDNGVSTLNQLITGGSYSVAANGRGTASITSANGTSTYSFYLVKGAQQLPNGGVTGIGSIAVFLETDSSAATEGLATWQNIGIIGNNTFPISGSFALTSVGVVPAGGFESVGRITATAGAGTLSSGVEDVMQAGTFFPNLTLSGSYAMAQGGPPQVLGLSIFTGTGRGTAQLNGGGGTSNVVFYMVDDNVVEYLEVDPSQVIVGFVEKQF